MQVQTNLDILGQLKVQSVLTAGSGMVALFVESGFLKQKTLGSISLKNENEYLPGINLSFPSMFNLNSASVNYGQQNLTASLASQTANTFLAGPNGYNGTPTFRTIAAADLPAMDTKITIGTIKTAANANGLSIVGSEVSVHKASFITGGALTADYQEIGGVKAFNSNLLFTSKAPTLIKYNPEQTGSYGIYSAIQKSENPIELSAWNNVTGAIVLKFPAVTGKPGFQTKIRGRRWHGWAGADITKFEINHYGGYADYCVTEDANNYITQFSSALAPDGKFCYIFNTSATVNEYPKIAIDEIISGWEPMLSGMEMYFEPDLSSYTDISGFTIIQNLPFRSGSGILNQIATTQSANFSISGTGSMATMVCNDATVNNILNSAGIKASAYYEVQGYTRISSASGYMQLTTIGGAAQRIAIGGLLISDSYGDMYAVPANGAYIKGIVRISNIFNGAGDFVTTDAAGYLQRRTVAQIISDTGFLTGTVAVTNGGTGRTTGSAANAVIATGTTATGAQQTIAHGIDGSFLRCNGSLTLPTFTEIEIADISGLTSALSSKQATLVNTTNIKSINGSSILGSGNLTVASTTQGVWILSLFAEATTVTTGVKKYSFRVPYGITVTDIRANLVTAGTAGLLTVDINKNGTSIMTTRVTVDVSEFSSYTAATPPVISNGAFSEDDEISFDVDVTSTTAKGLKMIVVYNKT